MAKGKITMYGSAYDVKGSGYPKPTKTKTYNIKPVGQYKNNKGESKNLF